MASIGKLHLGASKDCDGICYFSSMACTLSSPAKQDIRLASNNGEWLVTAIKGDDTIVARSPKALSEIEVTSQGIKALMQALDLLCVNENITTSLSKPTENYISIFHEGDDRVLAITSTSDREMSINLKIEARDQDGNLIPQPEAPPPSWHRAFRYYRLSQLAADIYEAYRNLYLAFECLAESCYPRRNNEKEGDWVRRCFTEFHANYDLSRCAPDAHSSPSEFLFGTLYKYTRCNLFHSRTQDAILPFYEIDTIKLDRAYDTLLRVWRQIAAVVLRIKSGGGIITYQGYRLMSQGYAQNTAICITDYSSPISVTEHEISPSGYTVHYMGNYKFIDDEIPGIVTSEAEEKDIRDFPLIHRIGLVVNNILHMALHIPHGLNLDGIDKFRVVLNHKLVQGSMPKTQF